MKTRCWEPGSFIVVLDNVALPGETIGPLEGQTVRNKYDLEALFTKAGLLIHGQPSWKKLHDNYKPVMVWTLY